MGDRNKMTTEELEKIVSKHEIQRLELKESFGVECFETACAFTNDITDSKRNGYLLVGVHDDGRPSGQKATDELLKNLAAIRSDENDCRNPIITDAMRTLGYVNRFGRGIGRVKAELIDNGNGEPSFDTAQIGSFRVAVGLTKYAMEAGGATLPTERPQESGVKSTESSQRLAEGEESRNESKECPSKSEGGTGESVPASPARVPRGAESVPRGLGSIPSGLECSPSRRSLRHYKNWGF